MNKTMGNHNDWWVAAMNDNKWVMPYAPWWKRLPIIRHIRAFDMQIKLERDYAHGIGLLGLRTGYDEWVIHGIWYGLKGEL